jgi:hypothetical protein
VLPQIACFRGAGFEGLGVVEVLLWADHPAGLQGADNGQPAVEPDTDHPGSPRPVYALPIANAALSRRVQKIVADPPLSEMSDLQRRELHEALLDADTFEDLSSKWQAAVLKGQKNRPDLRIVGSG